MLVNADASRSYWYDGSTFIGQIRGHLRFEWFWAGFAYLCFFSFKLLMQHSATRYNSGFFAFLQIYCLFLFIIGACLFGTLISQLNEILQAMNRKVRALENHLDGYISFMADYRHHLILCSIFHMLIVKTRILTRKKRWVCPRVPRALEKRVRSWVHFQFTEEFEEKKAAQSNIAFVSLSFQF